MPENGHKPLAQVELAFGDGNDGGGPPPYRNLSAVAHVGETLFLACDETAGIESLRRRADGSFGDHHRFGLDALVDLPGGPDGEMDIEGLCAADGFLWVVGSHSLKRRKPKRDENDTETALARMKEIEREPNRYFFGRIPLEEESPGFFRLGRATGAGGAAWLHFTKRRSALADWLRDDPLLSPFLAVPSKENGFDVEGIAVRGERAWIGLRGPVLGGHAVVLDLAIREKPPGRLTARRLDGPRRYRKHLLDTGGLGIRDMRLDGDDLLLLVGPTMSLDGPAFVLRWRDAVRDEASGVIDPARIETVAELPYELHADHPEGLELWPAEGRALLVIYDAPAPERVDVERSIVRADVIAA